MQISLQNFSSLVESMAASVQGACSQLIDLAVGSVLRSTLEASASVALWLQYLLLQVLSLTRLASSVGTDVDSWVADFGLTRLAASAATGQVTLSSFNPSVQAATITSGVTLRTSDGSQSFAVVGGPYVRALGVASVTVPVSALVAGTQGNVQPGVVIMLGTAIPGIDTVSNALAFTGGTAAESDAALRARFVQYINTRAQATEQAIGYAISAVQQGLSYTIQENMNAAGQAMPGNVLVVVDDGSGSPASGLIQKVVAAIDQVRPLGTTISVSGPQVVAAIIGVSLTVVDGVDTNAIQSLVSTALVGYVDGLAVGQALRYTRIAGLCYDASVEVVNVQSVTLNGTTADLMPQVNAVVRVQTINVSVLNA